MTEEPYRWLEAIQNRREYIQDHLKGATPVFAASRPEGILLLGVGQGQSKVFEIYDRHALGALGHPVDIEKVRQSAIEAAIDECDRFYPAFQFILWGDKSPAEALASAMVDAAGEA